MPYVLNLAYALALVVLSPWLLYRILTTSKYRRGLLTKLTGAVCRRAGTARCVWFHGVSLGEIHLLRPLVAGFRLRHPDWQCVVSTTTETGYTEARKLFSDLPVFWWPLDFSWAVRRALRRVRPDLVVLAESELWPNFLWAAHAAGVAVAVVNGRLSPRSWHRYQRFQPLVRWLFSRVGLWAVQTTDYAAALQSLGVPGHRIAVTGSVKYDGATFDRYNPRTLALGRLFGISPDDLVWIAGSTQAPEEEMIVHIYRSLKPAFPRLRLFLVPRQKERFDEVAALLERLGQRFCRRSQLLGPTDAPVADLVLVDSIGELGALWGLADVAFVGGSLDGQRGGQNMIEPAAYGAAVVFGPHVWNFRETAARLLNAEAAIQVADADELARVVRELLADPLRRGRLGHAARSLVQRHQGATARTLDLLDEHFVRAASRAA
ncbi:MAG: 3-deoxy-D-manno-octulosonic acid transferase [Gemmataceae bacterium]|nr:3-deoxy-D-manno-octulosonic acid transferase [Gemmataceae bacterium]MDW8265936.1 3-deoxy-D-manno-octulosonic acid transferase [Gemmataceae bacterium]